MLRIDFNLIFTVINILVLFGGLWFVLFKPVRKILDERQAEANREYDDAKAKQAEANAVKEKYDESLEELEKGRAEAMLEARRRADGEYQRIIDRAEAQAKDITDQATLDAENQRKKILKSAEDEIADMVVEAAGKVAGTAGGADFDRALYDEFISKNAGDNS
ncbi:MAG: ATP synthase F0 subunit B [Eubacterium sp.]|nr:ATP synthase F0 subunit B [Eubacterium sp.]